MRPVHTPINITPKAFNITLLFWELVEGSKALLEMKQQYIIDILTLSCYNSSNFESFRFTHSYVLVNLHNDCCHVITAKSLA